MARRDAPPAVTKRAARSPASRPRRSGASEGLAEAFSHWMGQGWGAVTMVSLITTLCLAFGAGPTSAPWLIGLLVIPGGGLVVSGIGYWMTGHPKHLSVAIGALGMALIGGGLDYFFPNGPFRVLYLPVGIVCLVFAGSRLFTARGRAAEHTWVGVAGGLLGFAGASWFGLVGYLI